jgi:hypothetical protein
MIGLSNGFFCVVIPQACPLNPTPAPSNGQQQLLQDFSERFLPAIRDVVEFAKRLPGFTLLAEDDKVTLLKPGVFEVLLVRLAAMFDSQVNKKKTKRKFDWEMFDIHLISIVFITEQHHAVLERPTTKKGRPSQFVQRPIFNGFHV